MPDVVASCELSHTEATDGGAAGEEDARSESLLPLAVLYQLTEIAGPRPLMPARLGMLKLTRTQSVPHRHHRNPTCDTGHRTEQRPRAPPDSAADAPDLSRSLHCGQPDQRRILFSRWRDLPLVRSPACIVLCPRSRSLQHQRCRAERRLLKASFAVMSTAVPRALLLHVPSIAILTRNMLAQGLSESPVLAFEVCAWLTTGAASCDVPRMASRSSLDTASMLVQRHAPVSQSIKVRPWDRSCSFF
jgi:hypothetical protein